MTSIATAHDKVPGWSVGILGPIALGTAGFHVYIARKVRKIDDVAEPVIPDSMARDLERLGTDNHDQESAESTAVSEDT